MGFCRNLWKHKLSNFHPTIAFWGVMFAFDTVIKGMHPFPRNMLINATFGPWVSLSSPGVEAVGIYDNKGKRASHILGDFSITTTVSVLRPC